jgi:hypothetical protein
MSGDILLLRGVKDNRDDDNDEDEDNEGKVIHFLFPVSE